MRKTLIYIFGIAFLHINLSCKTHYSTAELQNNFSKDQIFDLMKISDFFRNELCSNSNFKSCYYNINHELLEAQGAGCWSKIDFKKQEELYKKISKSTFDEIWFFCKSTDTLLNQENKNLCAKTIGKYGNYLFDLGKQNPRIKKYAERVYASGDYGFLDIHYSEVLKNKKAFNLNDPNIQLILAIHYLSLNDHANRTANIIKHDKTKFN